MRCGASSDCRERASKQHKTNNETGGHMEAEPVHKVGGPDETAAHGATQLVYVLQSVGMIFGITWIAAVVVNYVKLDQARGTWLESHFRWQMRTFWFGLLWHALGVLTVWIFIGFAILT